MQVFILMADKYRQHSVCMILLIVHVYPVHSAHQSIISLANEVEVAKAEVAQLQERYIDITSRAAEDMSGNVTVQKLRYSVLCLPPNLKKEHKTFIKKAKADIKKAHSIDDVLIEVGTHCDFLNYSLLKYVIDLYGSDEMKKEMVAYVERVKVFRKETRLEVFSEVYDHKIEKAKNFSVVITKHEMDWATATLEDVEKFRNDICCELSLYTFSLNLLALARGCVEITWRVPRSLSAYIQRSIKPSSPSMRKHHVSQLIIDGFIAYDNTTGMCL